MEKNVTNKGKGKPLKTDKNPRKINWLLDIRTGISIAIILGMLNLVRIQLTSRIYSTEVLSIKDYYGNLTLNDKQESNYFFVKLKFSKPFYASSLELFPEKLHIFNAGQSITDEYRIVTNLVFNEIYLPEIITRSKIIQIAGEPDSSKPTLVLYECEDMVAKVLGDGEEPKSAESFDDIRQDMLSLPFTLKPNDEITKVFIFKMDKGKSADYNSKSLNFYYKIIGKNINLETHQFATFFSMGFYEPYKNSQPSFIDYSMGKYYFYRGNHGKAIEFFEKALIKDQNNYLAQIYKGITKIYLGNHTSGNEIIKINLNFLSKTDAIDALLDILTVNRNVVKDRYQTKYYIDYGLSLSPNSIIFHNFLALYLMEDGEFQKALDEYESMTPRLTLMKYHYRLFINKGFVLHFLKNHKLSNYYLLKYLEDVKNEKPLKIDLLESMYACLALNYYFEGENIQAYRYLNKLTIDKYRVPVEKRMNNEETIMFFRFCYY